MLRPVLILLLALVEKNSCQGGIVFMDDDNEGDNCTLADGATGRCGRAEECEAFLKSTPQRDWKRCTFNKDTPIFCCPGISPSVLQGSPNQLRSGFISERMCDGFPQFPEASNHIFKGAQAEMTDFPYLGALAYKNDYNVSFRCGASLISREYALTAAHCVTEQSPVFIRLGAVTIFGDDDNNDKPVDIGIANITIHPNYRNRKNDIALLKLNRSINAETESFLIPACLYTNSTDPSPNVSLSIAGWGSTVFDPIEVPMSPDLMKATVTAFDRAQCDLVIKAETGLRKKIRKLSDDQLCAVGRNATGHNTGDTCHGDSGGPLELAIGRRRYIVGITSTGSACGYTFPGIYTRVSHFIDWIESIVWPPA